MNKPEWILALNTGSTSIKFAAFARADLSLMAKGAITDFPNAPRWRIQKGRRTPLGDGLSSLQATLSAIVEHLLAEMGVLPAAIGHRIVHGADRTAPLPLDELALAELRRLSPLAPLHQPMGIDAAEWIMSRLPGVPNYAVFDTSFHQTMPEAERILPLPREYAEQGIKRYGFHGLSFQSVAETLRDRFGEYAGGRVVVAHLGGGTSLCALHDGQSRATTMGLTPAGGVPSATRSGDLDPGVVLALVRQHGIGGVDEIVNRKAGMLGISGRTGDVTGLLGAKDHASALALEVHVRRIQQAIAAMAMAIGGMDMLVFTGGAGNHAPELRRLIVEGCDWLGATLDAAANSANAEKISTAASSIAILQIAAEEELVIAHAVRECS